MVARYLGRQALALIVLLLIGSFVIFAIVYLAPGDPIAALLGTQPATPERVAQLQAQYHLDQSFLAQYWLWLSGALRGDFGQSIIFQSEVSGLIAKALPVSVPLILMSEALIVVFGVSAAAISARYRGAPDAVVSLGTSAAASVPVFVFAVVLSIVFGRSLGLFPTVGAGDGPFDRMYHLFLPALAIAVAASALLARVGRSAMREEIDSPHVTTEVARGVPYPRVFRRHVLRNSLPPIVAVVALQIPALIAGTVVVERAFNLGGVGTLLLSGVSAGDFPLVQAIALLIVFVTVTLGVAVDVLYGILDPRVKIGSSR